MNYTFDVILQKSMNSTELQQIRNGFSTPARIIAFKDSTVQYDSSVITFQSNQELYSILSQSASRFLLIYQRAAILQQPWEERLFSHFEHNHSCPEAVGCLTTHNGAKLSAIINHLKADEFSPPKEMTLPNLTRYIQETNSGETLRVPVIDSPVYATTKEIFLKNNTLWGNFSHGNQLIKVLAQDIMAHEIV